MAKEKVAILGMGIIGSRCADNLTAADYNVATWNRSPKDRQDITPTAADAAKGAHFLLMYLKDGVAVREVFSSIADFLTPDQTVINHSTVDLETTKWLAGQCAEIGCPYLDAPFTGSKDAAANGELVYYIGGESSHLENCRALLEVTSKEIKHFGLVGSATVIKITTNLVSACTVQALSEGMAIATGHGITPETFADAVASNACGSVLAAMKLPTMASGDYETHFSLDNMRKDSGFALQLADVQGLDTPAIRATSERMAELCRKGHAQLDYSALFKAYE